ncbi:hypothetical protein FQZ97_926730 [compost metagenome]
MLNGARCTTSRSPLPALASFLTCCAVLFVLLVLGAKRASSRSSTSAGVGSDLKGSSRSNASRSEVPFQSLALQVTTKWQRLRFSAASSFLSLARARFSFRSFRRASSTESKKNQASVLVEVFQFRRAWSSLSLRTASIPRSAKSSMDTKNAGFPSAVIRAH